MTLSAEDRLAILDVITRADNAATRRDPDSYVRLFTDTARLDGDQGTHRGQEALRAAVRSVWAREPVGTIHLTLNPVVTPRPGAPDDAVVDSVLLIVHPGQSGAPGQLITAAAITQHLRRHEGRWLIDQRTVGPMPADQPASTRIPSKHGST